MKRARPYRLSAVLAAAVLLLTGCRKAETYDYTQDYGDYLSYSLGADYQLKYDRTVYTADGSYCSRWRGQYTHPVLGLRQFTVEAIDNGLEIYASKQHWRDCSLLSTLYGGEKKEMLYDSAALTGIGEFTVAERYGDCKSIPAEMQEELLGILLKE